MYMYLVYFAFLFVSQKRKEVLVLRNESPFLFLFFSVISCGDPGVPIHGRQVNVSNNYKYGSFVEFDCSENYTFSGDRKIVCGETKDWSAPLPRCFGEFYFLWHRNMSG